MNTADEERRFVRLTILGGERRMLPAEVAELAGDQMRLVLDEAVPINTAVHLEFEESLLLGEVRFCRQEGWRYVVGIHLRHALREQNR